MTARIPIPRTALVDFCRRRRIRRLALFGSVLRDDFRPDSDVDALVEFEPDVRVKLADLISAEAELSALFNRWVDLGEWRSVEEDPNYLRRNGILRTAQVIYEAG
jgi:hypothetical protein